LEGLKMATEYIVEKASPLVGFIADQAKKVVDAISKLYEHNIQILSSLEDMEVQIHLTKYASTEAQMPLAKVFPYVEGGEEIGVYVNGMVYIPSTEKSGHITYMARTAATTLTVVYLLGDTMNTFTWGTEQEGLTFVYTDTVTEV
jgi:hypothetical protein